MNIIFDIDDTITNETIFMLKYAPQYLKRKYGSNFEIKKVNGYSLDEVFGLREYFAKENLTLEEIDRECKKTVNGFWNFYFIKYMLFPIRKEAQKTIKDLKSNGNNIYLLSTRGKKTHEAENKTQMFIRTKLVPILTLFQMKINGIRYNQIKLVENEEEKIDFCKKIKARIVVDDKLSFLQKLPEEVVALYIETLHSANEELPDNINRITDLSHVKMVLGKTVKSKKGIKKNVKLYEKIYTESFYKVVRLSLKKIFIKKFNPIVTGVENIPNDKRAVVYVSNHRNNFDPLISTLYIRHPTHWIALLRLFQAKENLFGRNDIVILKKISAFIVKSMGSIPIARENDDNFRKINIDAMFKIDEYIKLNSSIGFYPEGTLNRKPEETNLLPLKSDTIFSIAVRNNSWLQPVVVVWTPKDLDISNKVVISFLEPIETTGMTSSEVKEEWLSKMNNRINKINIYFENMRNMKNAENMNYEKRICSDLLHRNNFS